MKKTKKTIVKPQQKPFFLEDSNGKLYKATAIADEEVEIEAEEEVPAEDEEELVEVKLTKAQYDKLMKLLSEEAVSDEDPEEEGDEEDEHEDPEVVDTADSKTPANKFVKSSTTIEQPVKKTEDSVSAEEEVNSAWLKRYAK